MDTSEPREPTPRKRRRHAKASVAPTLRDVARAASVSTASVSRALSRPELVSEEVRGRVRAAVRTLAYVPNAAAQALSGRPERLVGAVVTTLGDPPTMLALEALSLELARHGAALLTAVAGDGEAGVAACTRGLLARGAEAIVFGGGATPVDPGRNRPWASLDEPVSRSAALADRASTVPARWHLSPGTSKDSATYGLACWAWEASTGAMRFVAHWRTLASKLLRMLLPARPGRAAALATCSIGGGLCLRRPRLLCVAAIGSPLPSCRNASGRISRCPGNYRSWGTAIPNSRDRYARHCPRFGCPQARQVQPWPAACSRSWTAVLNHRRNSTPNLSCASRPGHAPKRYGGSTWNTSARFHVEPRGRSFALSVPAGSIGSPGFAVSLAV